MTGRSITAGAALATAALGAGCVAYGSLVEVRSYRLRRVDVPVLAPGSKALRVLHLSDIHFVPGQRKKQDWLRRLAELEPDLVVNTGDNLSHLDAVPPVLDALSPLAGIPGVFVFGSNDYYAPQLRNPGRYLVTNKPVDGPKVELPWRELRNGLIDLGWVDLSNASAQVKVDGRMLAFTGVDDPHVRRDRYDLVAGPADPSADLAVGVTHAPYLRTLDAMNTDGYPLILAGHTHGGQLCVPGWGALVTNCDLDTRRVKGLSTHRAPGHPDSSWLHVSAGLGTSRYAPIRFACPPEATLLTLVARP